MLKLGSFRDRLHQSLSRITPEKTVGASGLAILCATSTLALAPPSDQTVLTTLMQWLGGLGLNVLAGILQQEYQNLLSQPARDEQERLIALSEALTKHIRRQAELRREIGAFLGEDNLDAFRIAEEVVQGNPAVHGWLLVRIYQDVTEYRADFDQIHKLLAEMKSLIEQLLTPILKVSARIETKPQPPLGHLFRLGLNLASFSYCVFKGAHAPAQEAKQNLIEIASSLDLTLPDMAINVQSALQNSHAIATSITSVIDDLYGVTARVAFSLGYHLTLGGYVDPPRGWVANEANSLARELPSASLTILECVNLLAQEFVDQEYYFGRLLDIAAILDKKR